MERLAGAQTFKHSRARSGTGPSFSLNFCVHRVSVHSACIFYASHRARSSIPRAFHALHGARARAADPLSTSLLIEARTSTQLLRGIYSLTSFSRLPPYPPSLSPSPSTTSPPPHARPVHTCLRSHLPSSSALPSSYAVLFLSFPQPFPSPSSSRLDAALRAPETAVRAVVFCLWGRRAHALYIRCAYMQYVVHCRPRSPAHMARAHGPHPHSLHIPAFVPPGCRKFHLPAAPIMPSRAVPGVPACAGRVSASYHRHGVLT